jgi:hypothetical protein
MTWRVGGLLIVIGLAGCSSASPAASPSPLQVYAVSGTATPEPIAPTSPTAAAATATPVAPVPTPTAGPVVFTLDFSAERKDDVTLHVGQALQLKLMQGPTADWLSGVDDARVLRPMAPDKNGIYQAMAPGTALVTAHVPFGCANVTPNVPCRNPEHGLWFQTRVWVVA